MILDVPPLLEIGQGEAVAISRIEKIGDVVYEGRELNAILIALKRRFAAQVLFERV